MVADLLGWHFLFVKTTKVTLASIGWLHGRWILIHVVTFLFAIIHYASVIVMWNLLTQGHGVGRRNKAFLLLAMTFLNGPMFLVGCSQVRLPAIDPSGERIFLPAGNSTTLAPLPGSAGAPPFGPRPAFQLPENPPPCDEAAPPTPAGATSNVGQFSIYRPLEDAKEGALVMHPRKIIAPINSDVVLRAGLCGAEGYYVKGQRLEWMMSQESVGNFIDVREGSLRRVRNLLGNDVGKQGIDYAIGYTSRAAERMTKGTPLVQDDLVVHPGQGWVSVSSPSEGTSHVTCMAPRATGWDRRRQTATIHWIDANWKFPPSQFARAGQAVDLTTLLTRASTGDPIEGWEVDYTIIPGGMAAGFEPTGTSNMQGVRTNSLGHGTARLRQSPGQTGPGVTNVRIDVTRPGGFPGEPDKLQVASQVVTIQWSSPALTLIASGPQSVGRDTPFTYRMEVSNPGDQPASGVTATASIPPELTIISTNPQAEFVGGTLRWNLGEVQPGQAPRVIDVAVKGNSRATVRPCFNVQSTDPTLPPLQKCLDTIIAVPCLAMQVEGPDNAQVGDNVTYLIRIQNQCDEPVTGIKLVDTFESGLSASGKGSPLAYRVFDLQPGAIEDIELAFDVLSAGRHCHQIQVTADGGHTVGSVECIDATDVPRPDIDLRVQTNPQIEVGEGTVLRATVLNRGNVPLREVRIAAEIPAELFAEDSEATAGFTTQGNQLVWQFPELQPGQSAVAEVITRGVAPIPNAVARFVATAESGLQREQVVQVQITEPVRQGPINPPNDGGGRQPEIPVEQPNRSNQLKVGVTALTEPVAVGQEAEYLVVITNDRNVSDRDVATLVTLPEGLQYVGGRADDDIQDSQRSPDGRQIVMQTVRELRAGESIGFRVRARATLAGRHQVRIESRSGQTPQPVGATATTTVN